MTTNSVLEVLEVDILWPRWLGSEDWCNPNSALRDVRFETSVLEVLEVDILWPRWVDLGEVIEKEIRNPPPGHENRRSVCSTAANENLGRHTGSEMELTSPIRINWKAEPWA